VVRGTPEKYFTQVTMLTNLLAIINTGDFEDNGILRLTNAVWLNDAIEFHVEVGFQDATPSQQWQITCAEPKTHRLKLGFFDDLVVERAHVLLWPYKYLHTQVSFCGVCNDPFEVVGALYQRHREIAKAWFPFHQFLNGMLPLPTLLTGNGGLLASGPEPLMLAYEEVLNHHGLQASHLESRRPIHWEGIQLSEKDSDLQVLLLGASYIVAQDFQCQPIGTS
jgi:hypothetical protein